MDVRDTRFSDNQPDLVIHSCTSESYSGLERYVLDLVAWQYRMGKPVELFCREGSELAARARDLGIPIWTIGPKEKWGPKLWWRMSRGWSQRLNSSRVTLHMHAGGEPWYHLPWLMAHRLGGAHGLYKSILHYHIWINHKKKDLVHDVLFRGIDEVWTSSETARAHLSTLLPVAREKIRVVPYGRDIRALTEIPYEDWRAKERKKLRLTEESVLGVCVSRIEPIKGVGELFDAFTELAPELADAHLAIVGDVSPNNDEAARFWADLESRYKKLPEAVRARLHFLGYLPDCRPVLAAADFYVLPSYEECMSLALLDALILGLPAIGTKSGGTPSVARPEETGILVQPRDKASLKSALSRMYQDRLLRQKLSVGARELGRAFDQEKIFDGIWRSYAVA